MKQILLTPLFLLFFSHLPNPCVGETLLAALVRNGIISFYLATDDSRLEQIRKRLKNEQQALRFINLNPDQIHTITTTNNGDDHPNLRHQLSAALDYTISDGFYNADVFDGKSQATKAIESNTVTKGDPKYNRYQDNPGLARVTAVRAGRSGDPNLNNRQMNAIKNMTFNASVMSLGGDKAPVPVVSQYKNVTFGDLMKQAEQGVTAQERKTAPVKGGGVSGNVRSFSAS